MAKPQVKSLFTNRDKASPAYRKWLETENASLRTSLQETQNQASTLQNTNNALQSELRVLKNKLNDFGLTAVFKDFAFLVGGAAIPYLIDGKYLVSSVLFFITFFLVITRYILGNFKK